MTNAPLPVLVNREGGAASAAGDGLAARIAKAFADAGLAAEVQMLAASDISAAIEAAAKSHDRITVAGGDGTIAGAAQILAGTDTELALLPLGTLNHLARDLGIPADLAAAAKIAAQGKSVAIDLGEVNGHRFINNASIGLYPSMVDKRDAYRSARHLPKWLASIPASWEVLSRLRHHRLHIDMGDGARPLLTPLLFVGNNRYSLEAGTVGKRATLHEGSLSIYAVASRRRLSLIWFAMRALVGRADRSADFVTLGKCPRISVAAHSGAIDIALDGETRRLRSPLAFSSLSGALRVVVPDSYDPIDFADGVDRN